MKKWLTTLLLVFFLFGLSACDFFFDEEEEIDTGRYTEQELIQLIESLMPEAYENVYYDLDSFEEILTNIVERNQEAVVGLRVSGDLFTASGTGSAVVYKKDGSTFYAVTNHHVIENYRNIEVVYERNGMLFSIPNRDVEVLGKDATTDLAVLTFKASDNFPVVAFADSYDLRIGQFAIAIGNPLGFDYYGTVTMGIVSGLSRYVPGSDLEVPFIQHDAAISPGNSGGALFDINGNLIGINNMKIVSDKADNIGFAIPSNTVARIVEDLEEKGYVERPYLGVRAMAQVSDCNQPYGVCLSQVESEGAAAEAGLEVGDIIVGYKLEGWDEYIDILNFNDLREAILNSQVGDRVSLQYYRNDALVESAYVTLQLHPDDIQP